MTARVYATVDDYQSLIGDVTTPQARVARLLARASLRLDTAMIGAVYATDPNGYPADAGLADVMRRATCYQVQFMVDMDDDTGVKQRLDQVTVGGLNFHRAQGTAGLAQLPIAPDALSLLQTSGVLQTAPMIAW